MSARMQLFPARFAPVVFGLLTALLVTSAFSSLSRASRGTDRWGMPDPKVVIAEAKGSDRLDQLAQMAASLSVLSSVVYTLAPTYPNGQGMRDIRDSELYRSYHDSGYNVEDAAYALTGSEGYPEPHSARYRWWQRTLAYREDAEFIRRTLRRYVPAALVERYLATPDHAGRPGRFAEWKAADRQIGFENFIRPIATPLANFTTQARHDSPSPGSRAGSGAAGVARVVLLAMLLFWAWVDLGHAPRLSPDDPTRLTTGKRTYTLQQSAGSVHAPTEQIESTTHVTGGGNNTNVSSYVTRTKHVQFFIRSRSGHEEAINDTNINFPVRDGHLVSVVSAGYEKLKHWPYLLMRNHTLSNYLLKKGVLDGFTSEKKFVRVCAATFVWFGAFVAAILFKAFTTFILMWLVMLTLLAALRRRRAGELEQALVRHLLPVLDAQAQREL